MTTAAGEHAPFARERWLVLASVIALAALAWAYLWAEAERMAAMTGHGSAMAAMAVQGGTAAAAWNPWNLWLTFVMWSIMMVGMMLPSVLPAILLYASLAKKHRVSDSAFPSTWFFISGYLLLWVLFSVLATGLQASLQTGRLLTSELVSASPWLSGVLLIAAGIYQWLPWKSACLQKCRTPLQLFLFHWRHGPVGAIRMGAEHGIACLGCCWALMLLLFAVGVMNLLWVALIAAYVLVEKLIPGGVAVGRVVGIVLVLVGGTMVAAGA